MRGPVPQQRDEVRWSEKGSRQMIEVHGCLCSQ
jgi:hypothetical protein